MTVADLPTLDVATVLADPITELEVATQPDAAAATLNEFATTLSTYRRVMATWRQAAGHLAHTQSRAKDGTCTEQDLADALTAYQDSWNALEDLADNGAPA